MRRLSPIALALCVAATGACEVTPPPALARDASAGVDAFVADARAPVPDAGFAPFDVGFRDAEVPDPALDITVMTWNIEQFPMTTETASVVRQIITDLDVDLIGIQEIREPDEFDALVAGLEGYEGFDAWDSGFIRVGMIFKTGRIAMREVRTIFQDDWYAFPRSVLKADVVATTPAGTFDFVFGVLHLKASNDQTSKTRRRNASARLDEWVRAILAAGAERDVILVGDLNDRLTDERDDNVFLPFLDDPATYRFLTLPLEEQGEHTFLPFHNMIDHILITTDALDEQVAGSTEILALEGLYPDYERIVSDHRPVITRFRPR